VGDFLRGALVDWASFYANHAVVRTLVVFVHLGALLGAGGAAVTADRSVLSALRGDDAVRRQELLGLEGTHRVVVAGLILMALSGLLLFASDVDTFVNSRIFWTKMLSFGLLMANGVALMSAERRALRGAVNAWRQLRLTACASLGLWFLTLLAGIALTNAG
jgi:hypothetical protein